MDDWFRDESFWEKTYPFMFTVEKEEVAVEQAGRLISMAGITQGAILDLCCGPGRHAVPLAGRGFTVTGVDGSAFLLEKAREKARDAGVAVEWVEADMRRFRRPGAFDLVLSLYTSFGYFDDPDDDALVIRNMFNSLKPGGACIMDLMGREVLARKYRPVSIETLPDGRRKLDIPRIVADWTAVESEWILIDGDEVRKFAFRLRLYSGSELRCLLLDSGFDAVRLFGDMEGNAYDSEATRLVAVARRG